MQTTSTFPAWLLGLLRAIGVMLVVALGHFLGNAANLTPFISSSAASIVAALVLMIEHSIEAKTGSALFGAVRTTQTTK